MSLVLLALALLAGLASPPQDPVAASRESYAKVESYRVTLRSTHGEATEIIKYSFKKPGFVRMDFVSPHQGAVLTYDPKAKRVRLRPFGFPESMAFDLTPDNSLVKSPSGHRVDQSDIGALLERVRRLQQRGQARTVGEEELGDRPTLVVAVEGEPGQAEDGTHRFVLNLDKATMLPLKVRAYGTEGTLLEEVLMDDLETGPRLEDDFFRQ